MTYPFGRGKVTRDMLVKWGREGGRRSPQRTFTDRKKAREAGRLGGLARARKRRERREKEEEGVDE